MLLNVVGILLLAIGTILHIWTGLLLGLWGLVGLPKVSTRVRGRLVKERPFSIVRHLTYLAHTLMFSGIFLLTEIVATGVITLLDFVIINAIIIPVEEKEL